MKTNSALYIGSVMHRRLRPRPHYLRYRVFWMLVDLDEIDALQTNLALFSHNRFNVVSFYDKDHGDGSASPLRPQVEHHLREAGIDLDGGAIRLLCMPRIFGYGFNPISIYFCHRRDGELAAIFYEVHNALRERHTYLIPVAREQGTISQQCNKCFYVSPFIGMGMTYTFRVVLPGDRVSVVVKGCDAEGPLLFASLTGVRAPLTGRSLARAVLTHPLLTLKVMGAIHWHAVRLWLKGVPVQPWTAPPHWPVTLVTLRR